VDAEAEARRQLNLAENYRSVGAASKALGILRSIIEDFPNTAAAKEAKEQIKQMLEDETKKAGKGS
jgi:TolA-binding protein